MSPLGLCPEAAPALVNRSLSDHGNGFGQGALGSGGSSPAGRGAGAGAAAAALAPAEALSAMQRGSSERELAARWEEEAVASDKAPAEQVLLDAGAAGEPERKTAEERCKDPARAQPRAAEEGDTRVAPRPSPTLRPKTKPAPARGLCPHGNPRSKGSSCKRCSGRRADQSCTLRPVTVDSSKARTSLDALKISIRQLKWKEVRPGPAAWAQGGGQDHLRGASTAQARSEGELPRCATLNLLVSRKLLILQGPAPRSLSPGRLSAPSRSS